MLFFYVFLFVYLFVFLHAHRKRSNQGTMNSFQHDVLSQMLLRIVVLPLEDIVQGTST